MTPQTPATPDTKAAVTTPRRPPEEKFWQHYSPHHEFPLSTITSIALHVLGVVLLLVVGWVLIRLGLADEHKPPDVIAVEVAGGGGSKTGVQGGQGTGGNAPQAEDVGQPTQETPKENVEIKDIDVKVDPLKLPEIKDDQGRQIIQKSNEAIKRLGSLDADARSKLFGAVGDKGQGGSGTGGGYGSGEGPGHGPGKGAGKNLSERQKRLLRWSMTFNTENGEDYLRQLRDIKPGNGAILAIPTGKGQYEVIEDLSQRPAKGQIKDISTIGRISWVDDKPESVAGLARALGIQPPQFFIAFFPTELETELARLEREFANRNEDDIEETRFAVERAADGYHARVVAQTPKSR